MPEPMSAKELAAIKRELSTKPCSFCRYPGRPEGLSCPVDGCNGIVYQGSILHKDAHRVVAEVERLRARESELQAALEGVKNLRGHFRDCLGLGPWQNPCVPECAQARAALEEADTDKEFLEWNTGS